MPADFTEGSAFRIRSSWVWTCVRGAGDWGWRPDSSSGTHGGLNMAEGVCRRRVCERGCAEGVRGCAGVEVCWCVGVDVLMKFAGGRHDHQAAAAARCGGGRERSRMFKKDVCGLSLSLSRARVHEGVLFATPCHAPPRLPPASFLIDHTTPHHTSLPLTTTNTLPYLTHTHSRVVAVADKCRKVEGRGQSHRGTSSSKTCCCLHSPLLSLSLFFSPSPVACPMDL